MTAAQRLVAALVLGALCVRAQFPGLTDPSAGVYDPCKSAVTVNKGDSFVFGLAFWPGGSVINWGMAYNASNGVPGLNPCLTSVTYDGTTVDYRTYLSDRGVVFGTFVVKVDTLAAVSITSAEQQQLFEAVKATGMKHVTSVIAFRGMNRSEGHYVESDTTWETGGVGSVQQMGLILSFDRGVFKGFEWYDFGPCSSCGGMGSDTCIRTQYDANYQMYPQSSCAIPLSSCACGSVLCPANCSTTFYTAFRGSDKSGRTFTTAYQIQQIGKFSITGIFAKAIDGLQTAFANIGGNVLGGSVNALESTPAPPVPGCVDGLPCDPNNAQLG